MTHQPGLPRYAAAGDVPGYSGDPSALDELRETLLQQDYTEAGLKRLLGERPGLGPRADREVYARRLTGRGPAALVRLFTLGLPVERRAAEEAFAPIGIDALLEARLIELRGDEVRPLALLAPYDGLFLASDLADDRADFVTGVNAPAKRLAWLTVRRPVGSTLDLGTGCGIQALLAACHSERVVATDISMRALSYARFNVQLNGIGNVDLLHGDWLEPVGNCRFDLVVANPPYVVSPDSTYLFRDSDVPGDALSRSILGAVPGYLGEGGFGHILCSWVRPKDGDWREPLEAAIGGRGCDALLLHYYTTDVASYATSWNRELADEGDARFAETVKRWLEYYRREGIEAICWGMVVLRRRSGGGNWIRAIEVPAAPSGPCGDHVLRIFEGWDYQRSRGDEALLAEPFRLPAGTRVRPHSAESVTVEHEANVGFAPRVDSAVADVLLHCDGTRPLGMLTKATNSEESLATVRRLLGLGCLEPGGS